MYWLTALMIGILIGAALGTLIAGMMASSSTDSRVSDVIEYYTVRSRTVYAVTIWSDDGTEPVVTLFDNEESARSMVREHLEKTHRNGSTPDNICMDACEVYTTYVITDD